MLGTFKFWAECENTFLRPNTNSEYYSVFRYHPIPNTKKYLELRKSENRIQPVEFGLTIRKPNIKY